MSIPEVRDTDIQFSFERGDAYDDKIKATATYKGIEPIDNPVLLSEEYRIPSSYHPTGFAKGGRLFLATSLFMVGPITIKTGLQTNSTLRLIAGISMSAIFVISTIFSCGLMIRGEMGIKKFKASKIAELLPNLKRKALSLIPSEPGALSSKKEEEEEASINKSEKNPSEKTGLLSV
ncbi:MAG: hypothetical protein K1060chlam4_00650 [Candidatus Anoxychlamydiales bacterium]|nr:hypothetical protein [Candidatus Anoxychlamydiales bacterium]